MKITFANITDADAKKIAEAVVTAQRQERALRDAAQAEVLNSYRRASIAQTALARASAVHARDYCSGIRIVAVFVLGCFVGGLVVMGAFL